jgi:hypothetical protein
MGRRQFAYLAAGGALAQLVCSPLFSSDTDVVEVVGRVANVSAKEVDVRSGGQVLRLIADERTESWKGRTYHDFSQLEAGDSIRARCRKGDDGRLLTIALWANRVAFSGVISTRGGDKLEVVTDPSAHPETTYQEVKVVILAFDTQIQGGTKKELRKGRSVDVTGVDVRNGSVHATRVVLR